MISTDNHNTHSPNTFGLCPLYDDEWGRGRRVHGMVRAAAEDFLHESGVLLFLRSFARAATGPHTRHQCHTELSFYA